jgi:hypothetical protein
MMTHPRTMMTSLDHQNRARSQAQAKSAMASKGVCGVTRQHRQATKADEEVIYNDE